MTAKYLHYIVVLCLILSIVIIGTLLLVTKGTDNPQTHINPPSSELEPTPGDTLPPSKETPIEPLPGSGPVACTEEAKMCPDGSFVVRSGPNCEFAACSADETLETFLCTEEQKQADVCTMEYAPVCGLVDVQCITTPCDPQPQTFSNGCSACAQGNVSSYTIGECSEHE